MLKGDTYYSGEQWGQCNICGAITDVREGGCFTCADAQSIIGTGVDMYDRTVDNYIKGAKPEGDGPKLPVEFVNKRIQLLVKNGWRPPQKDDKEENQDSSQHDKGINFEN